MTAIPSPFVMTVVARQRGDELQAQANHYRLLKQAEHIGAGRSRRSAWPVLAVVMLALAVLLATGAAVAEEPPPQTQPSLMQAAFDPATSGTQKVHEAA